MILELEKVLAKITSINPTSETHGKKRVPVHSITLEMTVPNTVLIPFHPQLRSSFYEKASKVAEDPKTGQQKLDMPAVDDGLTQLKFPWWTQAVELPGELIGWIFILHTGNTEKSWLTLADAKVHKFRCTFKDLGLCVLTCCVNVHPDTRDKGRLDDLHQCEVKISFERPDTGQPDFVEEQKAQGNAAADTAEASSGSDATANDASATETSDEAPIEDPFAGTDLARGAVKSDTKVTTKKSRRASKDAPDGEQVSRDGVAWPFPTPQPRSPAAEFNEALGEPPVDEEGDEAEAEEETD